MVFVALDAWENLLLVGHFLLIDYQFKFFLIFIFFRAVIYFVVIVLLKG